VVKSSKLCNLRCRYCYEWNELGNRERLSLEGWERLLVMIREYHQKRAAELRAPFQSCIVWHGGEPMLLPLSYYEQVVDLQHRFSATGARAPRVLQHGADKPLYAPEGHARPLRARRFRDRRLDGRRWRRSIDRPGKETEDRVVKNMDRLRHRGWRSAPSSSSRLILVRTSPWHDFYESIGINLRVLPLFQAPLNTPGAPSRRLRRR
jgi:uncharacterized protein